MAAQSFQSKLIWFWLSRWIRKKGGFTLIELLVSIVIAALVITALLSLVVELVGTDSKEAARSETQREMQTALDFMSNELREAAYIYDGECLQRVGNGADCTGIFNGGNYIPQPANSVPILAFWKLDPIPNPCTATECRDARLAGRSYSLVVYYLSKDNPNNIWKGKARLLRYELAQFKSDGSAVTSGYAGPFEQNLTNPRNWPRRSNGGDLRVGTPDGRPDVLVDFVDLPETGDTALTTNCETNAVKTPHDNTLSQYGFTGVRSFYACVRVSSGGSGQNQKVVLFLKGNASGKSGISSNNVLPTLETQVLNRGVIDKVPEQ